MQLAAANFMALVRNLYPGRLIIVGMNERGDLVQLYILTGRSDDSRNRVLSYRGEGHCIFTEAADPARMKDPSLRIYNALREITNKGVTYHVISNGSQTDDVADGYAEDVPMRASLQGITYEPDSSHTQRITASSRWENGKPVAKMSILRKSPFSDACDPSFFERNLEPGFGYCIQTYAGDGNPLPAFEGEPYLLPFVGSAEWIAAMYWEALNRDNRVSLVVKVIPADGSRPDPVIINKYSKV